MGEASEGREVAAGTVSVEVFGRTDVGLVREHNEDNFLVANLESGSRSLLPEVRSHVVGPKGSLFAVCDGMGGAAAGEVASQIAADTVYELMQAHEPPESVTDLALRLEEAVLDAGKKIYDEAKADRTRRGMGTTITAAALVDRRVVFAQVGDSRAYVVRKDAIVQATRDQSLVNQLIEAGQLKPEEAELFEHSNIILQALGTAEDVSVDLTYVDLCKGDVLVMCSDGLSGLVSDDRIRETVVDKGEPIDVCKALTEAARDGGGHDNITVIVARFDGDDLPEPDGEPPLEYRRLEVPGRRSVMPEAAPAMVHGARMADERDAYEDEDTPSALGEGALRVRAGPPARRGPGTVWMVVAVLLVLGVGVGLGYVIVTGAVRDGGASAGSDGGPGLALDAPQPFIVCNFLTNVPGARLIVDGQDYDEIPEGGLFIDLPVGEHAVEARLGSEVVARRLLVLGPEDSQVRVPLLAERAPETDGGADGDVEAPAGDGDIEVAPELVVDDGGPPAQDLDAGAARPRTKLLRLRDGGPRRLLGDGGAARVRPVRPRTPDGGPRRPPAAPPTKASPTPPPAPAPSETKTPAAAAAPRGPAPADPLPAWP